MNAIGYFEIQSSNCVREMNFYQSLFGWKFFKEEYVPIDYYRIETKNINGGLLQRPAKSTSPEMSANAFVCSVQVESYDMMQQEILKLGGKIALPKFAIPGRCWQGYFTDLDNNTFGIFEVDEQAK